MCASGISGSLKTCENSLKKTALVGVFSHSAVNNDKLKDIQRLQEGFHIFYKLIRRNDARCVS